MRQSFPEPEFGTRTIARHIMRAGIRVSRPRDHAHLQRVSKAPAHVQHPTEAGQVWHLDMTEIRVLWRRIEIAAIAEVLVGGSLRGERLGDAQGPAILSGSLRTRLPVVGERRVCLSPITGVSLGEVSVKRSSSSDHTRPAPCPHLATQREGRAGLPRSQAVVAGCVFGAERLRNPALP